MRAVLLLMAVAAGAPAEESKSFPSSTAKLSQAEEIAIVKAGCDGNVTVDQYKNTTCSACPEEYPGGWRLGSVQFGHFKESAIENAFVEVLGCGTSTINQAAAMLLEKKNGAWRRDAYFQQKLGGTCRSVKRKDGRELLVCLGGWTWSGELHESIYVLDFKKEALMTELINTSDITGMGCMAPSYQADQIERVSFADKNGDGLEDLTVFATMSRGNIPQKQREQCPAEIRPSNLQQRTYQLVFYFDGEAFQPGPATKKAVSLFQN